MCCISCTYRTFYLIDEYGYKFSFENNVLRIIKNTNTKSEKYKSDQARWAHIETGPYSHIKNKLSFAEQIRKTKEREKKGLHRIK